MNHAQQHLRHVMHHFLERSEGLFQWSHQHGHYVSPAVTPDGVLSAEVVNRLPLLIRAHLLHINLHMSFYKGH